MRVTISIHDAWLRGVALERYSFQLAGLINESSPTWNVQIRIADTPSVVFDGDPGESWSANEILDMAEDITHPESIDF